MGFSLAAITAVISAASAMQASKARKSQAKFQAQVAQNNVIIADRKAVDAVKRGEVEARKHAAKVEQFQATQTVSLASQGVDITTGTSVDLLADTAELGAIDEQVIRHNSAREAYEHRVNAQTAQNQSTLFQAKAGAESPLLAGTSALASSLASSASPEWFE